MQLPKNIIRVCTISIMAALLSAYKVRCNKEQTQCEVDSKRLTAGDHVAIFDQDRRLVALGTVTALRGGTRLVHIDKKYTTILSKHELELITDEQFNEPKAFTFAQPSPSDSIGMEAGLVNLGIGNSLVGWTLSGYYDAPWRKGWRYFARGFFLSGSGKATITRDTVESYDVSTQVLGITGGGGYEWWSQEEVSFRTRLGIGFAQVSVGASGPSNASFAEIVDKRMESGLGLIVEASAMSMFRLGELRPYAAVSVSQLQRALTATLGAGIEFAL